MADESNPLKQFATADLVKELKARMQEVESARQELGFSEPSIQRAKYVRPKGNGTMKQAALDRWSKWAQYKKDHPNASTKDYFRARKAGKA